VKALAFLAGGAAGVYVGLYAAHKAFGIIPSPPSPLELAKAPLVFARNRL
jgi:hypothetical protein